MYSPRGQVWVTRLGSHTRVVLGADERLFGETSDSRPLRLVSTQTIGDGLAFLTYERVRNA